MLDWPCGSRNDLVDDHCGTFNAAYFNFRGTTTGQLRLGALDGLWPGRYRCVVSNSCGSAASTPVTAATCQVDINCDGFVDGIDYDLFNNAFESPDLGQQILADYNGDGFVDGIDSDAFNNAFETGC